MKTLINVSSIVINNYEMACIVGNNLVCSLPQFKTVIGQLLGTVWSDLSDQ